MSVAVGCLPIAGIIYGEGWARLRTMPRAFLSYSHDDEAFVAELEKQLPALGWDVWRDAQNLRPGDLWPRKLGDAIAASEAFVLVWSAHAARSGVIELVWTIAVAKKASRNLHFSWPLIANRFHPVCVCGRRAPGHASRSPQSSIAMASICRWFIISS